MVAWADAAATGLLVALGAAHRGGYQDTGRGSGSGRYTLLLLLLLLPLLLLLLLILTMLGRFVLGGVVDV